MEGSELTQSLQETSKQRRIASAFINPDYCTDETLIDLGNWFRHRPTEPKVYRNFLRPDVANSVAAAMRTLPVWVRYATIILPGEVRSHELAEETWHTHPDRAACHFVARPLLDALETGAMDAEPQRSLQRFLTFAVLGGPLRTWISTGINVSIERRMSIELAAYRTGDEILPHQDLVSGRILAINFYLDKAYQHGMGARLSYRNEEGTEFFVDPLFNTFSLIPIRDNCYHWVEPFMGNGIGRYTVSIGVHCTE